MFFIIIADYDEKKFKNSLKTSLATYIYMYTSYTINDVLEAVLFFEILKFCSGFLTEADVMSLHREIASI